MKIKFWSTEIGFQPYDGFISIPDNVFDYYEMCTDNTISVESIKTLYESEFPRHMKYHNPVKCMSDTHSFDIFSFKHKKNKILNNRKVVTQWDLSKSEVFSTTDHYSGRKQSKPKTNKQYFWKTNRSFVIFDQ